MDEKLQPTVIRVVLADDHPLIRDGIRSILHEEGDIIVVGEAGQNDEVLQCCLELSPDVLLLDLNMPRTDGREALKEIKADPELRRIPVVILTTLKAEEDIYRTYDLGANSYIMKPVTFDGLVEVMRGLGRYWVEIVELPNGQH